MVHHLVDDTLAEVATEGPALDWKTSLTVKAHEMGLPDPHYQPSVAGPEYALEFTASPTVARRMQRRASNRANGNASGGTAGVTKQHYKAASQSQKIWSISQWRVTRQNMGLSGEPSCQPLA